jgi:hypothetical protein
MEGYCGKNITRDESSKTAEVLGAQILPLSAVRTPARLHAAVRHLPDLLPRVSLSRHVARRDEIQLVKIRSNDFSRSMLAND